MVECIEYAKDVSELARVRCALRRNPTRAGEPTRARAAAQDSSRYVGRPCTGHTHSVLGCLADGTRRDAPAPGADAARPVVDERLGAFGPLSSAGLPTLVRSKNPPCRDRPAPWAIARLTARRSFGNSGAAKHRVVCV